MLSPLVVGLWLAIAPAFFVLLPAFLLYAFFASRAEKQARRVFPGGRSRE